MRVARLPAVLLLAGCLAGCAQAVRRALITYEGIASKLGPDHVTVRFDRSFLESNRERITMNVGFTVDVASGTINPAAFDGDIHISGRAPEIGLRIVAEIKNARRVPHAVALVRQAEASRQPLPIVAAFRYWPEHAIGLPHRQGEPVERLPNANPDHIFELHPVIRAGDIDLRETLHTVEGYRPGHASTTLAQYEGAELRIRTRPTTVLVETPAGLWNDVHFMMELTGAAPRVVADGRFMVARARDLEGTLLLDSVRVVLIKDSPPERVIRGLAAGSRLHVWGLPRVSFDGLARLIEAAASDSPAQAGKLPYEILIVGIYPEGQ